MTMRGLLLLGCALISAGCATARPRPILGHAHLSVVEPQTVTQTITSVGLIVEDGGVIVDGAHRCERHQNCLRGFWGLREASYCPSGKDEEGLQWWKSNGIDGNSFGTRYLKDQGVVQVVLGRFEAFVLLGPGMPHDELRYEP
ncbi:MAG: hypothetical protein JST92_25835, partial [Deltaproteobacteria bacterium]|nr:hypothetical protein [Deltaproteobacteria bacterium]